MLDDDSLLRQYAQTGDEAAFQELVRRHADLVYSACLRILDDAALAEDAAQAVFFILAQKARENRVRPPLGGWLYKTAVFAAREMRRNRQIQLRHEAGAGAAMKNRTEEQTDAEAETAWQRIRPHLDEVLDGLPAAQRDALVLRYFEKQSEADIAAALGCPVKTASSRLSRALSRVREEFRKRGVVLSAALLALLLDGRASTPAPAESLSRLAAMGAKTAAPSAAAGAIAQLMIRNAFLMKVKVAAVAMVCLALLACAVHLGVNHANGPAPQVRGEQTVTAKAKAPQPVRTAGEAQFKLAIAAIYSGDVTGLTQLLDDYPDLVSFRAVSATKPYEGYFGQATLLHHVSGNPMPPGGPNVLPKNIVTMATLLIDRGAKVDAKTVPGVTQPTDPGWTTLGLVASSSVAEKAGIQLELMKLLVAKGADVNFDNGVPIIGALYYHEMNAAEELYKMGARLDVRAAAGLGRADVLQKMFNPDGSLRPEGRGLTPRSLRPDGAGLSHYPAPGVVGTEVSDADIVAEALVFAVMCDQAPAVEFLLEKKMNINAQPGNLHGATALHFAAFNNNVKVVDLLLSHGANPALRSVDYNSTPLGWAEYNHSKEAAERLRPLTPAPEKPKTDVPSGDF
jgi:RNA polymerase sigma factor (sigma-70 family)